MPTLTLTDRAFIRLEPGNTIVIQPAGCDGFIGISTEPPGSAPKVFFRETADAEELVFEMPFRFFSFEEQGGNGSDGDGSQSEI